jgi:hypothetical protein
LNHKRDKGTGQGGFLKKSRFTLDFVKWRINNRDQGDEDVKAAPFDAGDTLVHQWVPKHDSHVFGVRKPDVSFCRHRVRSLNEVLTLADTL